MTGSMITGFTWLLAAALVLHCQGGPQSLKLQKDVVAVVAPRLVYACTLINKSCQRIQVEVEYYDGVKDATDKVQELTLNASQTYHFPELVHHQGSWSSVDEIYRVSAIYNSHTTTVWAPFNVQSPTDNYTFSLMISFGRVEIESY